MLQDEVLSINPKHYQEIYLLFACSSHPLTSLLPNTFFFHFYFSSIHSREGLPTAFPRAIQQSSLREELKSSMFPLTGTRIYFFNTRITDLCHQISTTPFLAQIRHFCWWVDGWRGGCLGKSHCYSCFHVSSLHVFFVCIEEKVTLLEEGNVFRRN